MVTIPPINQGDWTTKVATYGPPFKTPFTAKNVTSGTNSFTTTLDGNSKTGAEMDNKNKLGLGYYGFQVNAKPDSQDKDINSVFLYSNVNSSGKQQEQGFELDAEYNINTPGQITFGTFIDGQRMVANDKTLAVPKEDMDANGNVDIGFNIQNGKDEIGFINPSTGKFTPESTTSDKRINQQLASNLQPMSNSWSQNDKPGNSSITVKGYGRLGDAPK